MRLTQKATLKRIREIGMRAAYDPDAREYRVTFSSLDMPSYERREAVAAYCEHDDAISTAQMMRDHFERFGDHG
jgi:hypothetical protein